MKKLLCLPISFLLLSSFTNRKASTTSFDGKAYNSKEKMDFTSSTEEEIKSIFVKAVNQVIERKEEILDSVNYLKKS